MAKTFLDDQPKSFVEIATDDFKNVLKKNHRSGWRTRSEHNGLRGRERLKGKQLDFGIFHAHEFAWVQMKHPDLQPLLIAADKKHIERAYLIVHKNSPAKTIADLKRQETRHADWHQGALPAVSGKTVRR